MTRHFKIFYFILLVVFCHTFFIQANDAPIKSVGKTIQPRNDVPVRMVSEEVTIRLSSHRADVHCLFDLLNEGPPDTIDVGFPRGWE